MSKYGDYIYYGAMLVIGGVIGLVSSIFGSSAVQSPVFIGVLVFALIVLLCGIGLLYYGISNLNLGTSSPKRTGPISNKVDETKRVKLVNNIVDVPRTDLEAELGSYVCHLGYWQVQENHEFSKSGVRMGRSVRTKHYMGALYRDFTEQLKSGLVILFTEGLYFHKSFKGGYNGSLCWEEISSITRLSYTEKHCELRINTPRAKKEIRIGSEYYGAEVVQEFFESIKNLENAPEIKE